VRWCLPSRSRHTLLRSTLVLSATLAGFAAFASSALAGNFLATGHDQDFHCTALQSASCDYYKITTSFVRGSSTLPILILDRDNSSTSTPGGTGDASAPYEAVQALNLAYSGGASTTPTSSSPPYVVMDPQGLQATVINGTAPPGITTASTWAGTPLVDTSGAPLWSAIIIASDTNCGGCDLNNVDGTHLDSDAINARSSEIQTFFNDGGGLLYLAGATNAFEADGVTGKDVYYASVPVPVGGQPVSPPFTVTADGAALGVTDAMVNCCATHNSFTLPGADSPLKVAETDSTGLAESLFLQGGSVCSGAFCSGDQKITASGASGFQATEGAPATGVVATFKDPDTSATAAEYSASVKWGDGTTSTGTITGSGGNFSVSGTHTYAEEGSYTISVTITDVDNPPNAATVSTPATVKDAALHAQGISVRTTNPFSGTVATFSDDDPMGTLSDYTASVAWGDGTTSSGTIAIQTGFKVTGSHRYKKPGTYHVTVTIKDAGGSTVTATSTITIVAPLVRHGTARLTGIPAACTLSAFRVRVRGRLISSVGFSLGRVHLRTRTVHRGTQYVAVVSLSPGTHRLTVRVRFRRFSHTRSRTFHRTVSGCQAPPPKFTG
jgi:PKD domain